LWLWFFAYACVSTSAYFWPVAPKDSYVECHESLLPADAITVSAVPRAAADTELRALQNIRALIVRPGVDSYRLVFPDTAEDGRYIRRRAEIQAARGPGRNIVRLGRPPRPNVEQIAISLADMPNLERLYVGGLHDSRVFGKVIQSFPRIHVWHLDLNWARIASTIFLLLATLTLGGAVLQQSQALLSLPHARTVPGFAVPHLLIPLAIAGAGIVSASFIARLFGADFWATAAVQVFAWGAWSAFEFRVLSLPSVRWRGRRDPQVESDRRAVTGRLGGWSGAVLLLAIATCLAIFIRCPYVLESFLLGELPWLSAGFLAIGAALGAGVVVLMPTFCAWMNETGATAILSQQDVERRRVEHGILTSRFGRRVERLRRPSFMPRWLWQIHAMRSGNPDLLVPVMVRIVVPVVLVVGLQYFLLIVPAPNLVEGFPFSRMFSTAFVLLFLGAGWLIALSHTFSNWWQRRKVFSVELLYPRTRRQLTESAFAGYAFDALGILAVLFTTLIFCAVALVWPLGERAIWSGTLVIVLAAALLITGGLWLLTLRHRLLSGFLGVVGVLLLIGTMTSAVRFVQAGASLWRVALTFALVAWLFGLDAWRRWMKTEWGLFGRP
jgi:hypothetical protein